MRLPWLPQEYMRTCAECGHTWQVPRWARRRRIGTINMIATAGDSVETGRRVNIISAQNQQAEAFRHCRNCGADHFTQRASRAKLPG